MSDDYNTSDLVNRNWPNVELRDDGAWNSRWDLELAEVRLKKDIEKLAEEMSLELTSTVRTATQKNDEYFRISIAINGNTLSFLSTTSSHINGSECRLALRKLFHLVENNIGCILSIQGQPREMWHPWSQSVTQP